MRVTQTSDLWWKSAVVYCLDVETYLDWTGDGHGDLQGLAARLDYLAELGVNCLWLMPFYATPGRDDGYDVTDFYAVDPRLGSLGDLVEVLRTARDRGIRVIADLVVNHTSAAHPWFQSARSSRDSPYRDYYVWRDEPPEGPLPEPIFPDAEESVWTYDEQAGQYYLHRFYKHQPDLNVTNPKVREEIAKIVGVWLQLGMSGFRVDAVPFLIEGLREAGGEAAAPDPHEFLRHLRGFLHRRCGDAMLLGEVNLPYDEQLAFFGGGRSDELTMQFDFVLMQRTYLAMARGDAEPIRQTLRERPHLAREAQWATFLRNHDELTLDKLTEEERQEVFAAFGPEPEMQIFGRGLRRRLPPMFRGDLRRLKMAYSLLFSLPGTPTLYYGEEIGMGEELSIHGRHAVRTTMQWTAGPTGGFSTAPPDQVGIPVVEGDYGPDHVNVADQRQDPESLLSFMNLLVRRYRESPELGWGEAELLEQPHDAVLAHRCSWEGQSMLALHNLGTEVVTVPLHLPDTDSSVRLVDLLQSDGGGEAPDDEGCVEIELEGYGYRWLRVVRPEDRRLV